MNNRTDRISIDDMVRREVVLCVSSMVSELYKQREHFPDWEDELLNAYQGLPDYEDCVAQHGWTQPEDRDGLWVQDDTQETSEAETAEELYNEQGLDIVDFLPEVFEHWVVSPWFAQQLESRGERILEDVLDVGPVWCRCTTGQGIAMDWVVEKIYAEEITR